MFAIDTNLLVYAHNSDSPFHSKAKIFIEKVMNERDHDGNLLVGIPDQVLMVFVNVMTRQTLLHPLSLSDAIQIVQDYIDAGVTILAHQSAQIATFLSLLQTVTTRKKVFDVALAATLKDHDISGLYTVNVSDFIEFSFLEVVNPL